MNKYTVGIILGVLGAGLSYPVQASQIWQQEALDINYPTAQAPVVIEYNLSGPVTSESEIITTIGTIKTISLAYEFSGQVRLEASANAGIAYTKIVNGVPLVEGFVPGNQLRFKIIVEPESILKKITLSYTDSSGVNKTYRNPDLDNYSYRKEVRIAAGSSELFNYPLKIDLGAMVSLLGSVDSMSTRHSAFGTELYFTAADGQTPLYYYSEDPAHYYVNLPQIPQEGTRIYMYYGPKSTSRINAKYLDARKVFTFFDDFSAIVLDPEKWETNLGSKNEYSLKDGYLQLKDGLIMSRNLKINPVIIEFKARADKNASIQAVVRSPASVADLSTHEQIVYSSQYPGAEHTIAINDIAKLNAGLPIQPSVFYVYKVTLDPKSIIFERYSQDQKEKQAYLQFLDLRKPGDGALGLKANAESFNSIGSVYFDWVRVRPYIEIEPVAEVAA